MSVQFGKWNFEGGPADPIALRKVQTLLSPYAEDGQYEYSDDQIHILYFPFHTTKDSRRETQPCVSPSGSVLTWDGRLDNRENLLRELHIESSAGCPDASIVAAVYDRWGSEAFARLVGDWAISIWDPRTRTLTLATDFIGSRPLYYSKGAHQITWCTVIDPLVLVAEKSFDIQREYLAGWLSFFPAAHLTPYVGIHAVPPASFVLLTQGTSVVRKHWDFDPEKRIRYDSDAVYEEHFVTAFAESVRRRVRSDRPVLAELSGGMDSSSIVCMADHLFGHGRADTPRLDTVSYFDDSEPHWNERDYFSQVEARRGRVGCHIDLSKRNSTLGDYGLERTACTPGARGRLTESAKQFAACVTSNGSRVVLSGVGGDEVLGGVPTAIPELADLLATGRLHELALQLQQWALAKKTTVFHLLLDTVRAFLPPEIVGVAEHKRPVSWLHPDFVTRHRRALQGYESRLKLFGALPSFQENLNALDNVRRYLACSPVPAEPLYERRYPYLDRDLLEFLYSIPREQLVRPGQRRSLMRRSLAGIVPGDILHRKRKAFVTRRPLVAVCRAPFGLVQEAQRMITASLGIVSPKIFAEALQKARSGQETRIAGLVRTLAIESWLTHLREIKAPFLPSWESDSRLNTETFISRSEPVT